MSAGGDGATPSSDLDLLAPAFRQAVEAAIAECQTAKLDAMVYEAFRSQQLQEIYYARGRTVIPPPDTVTNAPTNLLSWHGYGLAVDVISKQHRWNRPRAWFAEVAAIFERHACKWGGHWTKPDNPHFQWGRCKPSPSPVARQLIHEFGLRAVWKAVHAE